MEAKVNGGTQERSFLNDGINFKEQTSQKDVSPMPKSNETNIEEILDVLKDVKDRQEDQESKLYQQNSKPSITAMIGAGVAVLTVCLVIGAYLVNVTSGYGDLKRDSAIQTLKLETEIRDRQRIEVMLTEETKRRELVEKDIKVLRDFYMLKFSDKIPIPGGRD